MLACGLLGAGLLALPASATQDAAPVEVVICASHHHVLPHWLRAAREGRLPAARVRVVHLDSHPDLAVPEAPLRPDRSREAAELLRTADIASFQLPAVWLGLVDHVVWVRPPFARQLPDGEFRFRLGLDPGHRLRVDDEHDYYVLDEGWAPSEALQDAVPVRLHVIPLAETARIAAYVDGTTILDVDLDAFATRNPAADRLRAAGLTDADLDALRAIFAPETLNLAREPRARIAQLDALMGAIDSLSGGPLREWPGALATLWRAGVGPRDLYVVYGILGRASPGAAQRLAEDGRDLVGLPEHTRVDPGAVATTALAVRDWLRRAPARPALVTVARSVDDGFTPRGVWPAAEWATLAALRDALGELTVRYDEGLQPAPRLPADSPALRPFGSGAPDVSG